MPESSRILTGLPGLPNDQLDPKLYAELQLVYQAIRNLLLGISQFTGIDPPSLAEISIMDPVKYLQGQNLNMWYPACGEAAGITRGQTVKVSSTGTALKASASSASGVAIGVAEESAALGVKMKVITSGLIDSIGGMTQGTLYYLSTTAGAIQNTRPAAAGQIIQGIGWAMSANQMLLAPSSYFQQL